MTALLYAAQDGHVAVVKLAADFRANLQCCDKVYIYTHTCIQVYIYMCMYLYTFECIL